MSDSDAPTLPSVIRAAIEARLADVHVSMPGRVLTYDKARQEVSVQPLLKLHRRGEFGDTVDALPVLQHVPVMFFGAGEYADTFPVSRGDIVLLVFSEASLDRWLVSDGGIVDPVHTRRFALTDAIAIPGLRTFRRPTSQVADNARVIAVPSGSEIRLGSTAASGDGNRVATKTTLDAILAALGAAAENPVFAAANPQGAAALEAFKAALEALGFPACASKVKAE